MLLRVFEPHTIALLCSRIGRVTFWLPEGDGTGGGKLLRPRCCVALTASGSHHVGEHMSLPSLGPLTCVPNLIYVLESC